MDNIYIYNRSKNIIKLEAYKDVTGAPLILGTEMDRGIIGAPQPQVEISKNEAKKLQKDPIVNAMLQNELELKSSVIF